MTTIFLADTGYCLSIEIPILLGNHGGWSPVRYNPICR